MQRKMLNVKLERRNLLPAVEGHRLEYDSIEQRSFPKQRRKEGKVHKNLIHVWENISAKGMVEEYTQNSKKSLT